MALTWRKQLIPLSRPQRTGVKMDSEWFTVHNTANPNATAANHANYECQNDLTTSYHYVIDDKECVLLVPVNEEAWHAGDGRGPGNTTSLAMEVCEFTDATRMANSIKNSQIAIAAIIEGRAPDGFNAMHLAIEDIVPHQKWSGKFCPRVILPNWTSYISGIRTLTGGGDVSEVTYRLVVAWAEDKAVMDRLIAKASALGVTYRVNGPVFQAHANVTSATTGKCKELEALIDAEPKLHRFHSILTPQNTAGYLGVPASEVYAKPWIVADPATVGQAVKPFAIATQDATTITLKR